MEVGKDEKFKELEERGSKCEAAIEFLMDDMKRIKLDMQILASQPERMSIKEIEKELGYRIKIEEIRT